MRLQCADQSRQPLVIEIPEAKDQELCVIGLCINAIETIDDAAKNRVVEYLRRRFPA